MVKTGDRQHDRDAERADDLEVDADLRDTSEEVDASDVERQLHEDQQDRADENLIRVGEVDGGVEDVVDQRTGIDDESRVHRGDRHDQRPAVDPSNPPAVARPDQVLAPLKERAGNRVVASQLGEDERHEELPEHHDRQQPDVSRTAGANSQDEQRIDADDRRDVAEGDREVLEQVEDAPQLLPVSKPRKLGGVGVTRLWRRDHGFATHLRLLRA